jgi:hypothetical protein
MNKLTDLRVRLFEVARNSDVNPTSQSAAITGKYRAIRCVQLIAAFFPERVFSRAQGLLKIFKFLNVKNVNTIFKNLSSRTLH